MKKVITLMLALMMVASLAACNAKPQENKPSPKPSQTNSTTDPSKPAEPAPTKPAAKEATPAEIEAAIAAALGDGYLATVEVPEEEIMMTALGRLDMEKVESYIAKQAVITAVNQDTVVIVKCKDGYADEAVKGFNDAYAQIISYIRQYPFSVAKVEGARLYKINDTVIYVIAGASAGEEISAEEEAKLAVSEYEKIDAAIKEVCGVLPENLAVIPEIDDSGDDINPFEPPIGEGGEVIGG